MRSGRRQRDGDGDHSGPIGRPEPAEHHGTDVQHFLRKHGQEEDERAGCQAIAEGGEHKARDRSALHKDKVQAFL